MPREGERGSLQAFVRPRGIRQLSLEPTPKKTRQRNKGSTKKSRTLRQKLLKQEQLPTSWASLTGYRWRYVRRTISRLTLLHNAIHGDGGLAFPDCVMKRREHLKNSSQNKFIELLPNTET